MVRTYHFLLNRSSAIPTATRDMIRRLYQYESYESILRKRRTARKFDSTKEIPKEVLDRVLRETQTSPSSFNLQPVKGIVIQNKAQREALSSCMIGNNGHRVQTAPLTLVILADMYGGRNTKPLMELERRHGGYEGYISSIPALVSFSQGSGTLSGAIKRAATHILSPIQPMPVIESREAWSYKNAGIFAQMFMISAAANGLGTLCETYIYFVSLTSLICSNMLHGGLRLSASFSITRYRR